MDFLRKCLVWSWCKMKRGILINQGTPVPAHPHKTDTSPSAFSLCCSLSHSPALSLFSILSPYFQYLLLLSFHLFFLSGYYFLDFTFSLLLSNLFSYSDHVLSKSLSKMFFSPWLQGKGTPCPHRKRH